MKNVRCLCAVFLTLVFLVSGCTAKEDSLSQPPVSEVLPPRDIFIDTQEELAEYLKAATLTDAEISQFLKEKASGFLFSDLETPEELKEFAKLVQTVGYPAARDPASFDDFCMHYYPEFASLDVMYYTQGGTMRYRFVYTQFDGFYEWDEGTKVETCDLDGAPLTLYLRSDGRLVGAIYANDYRIQVTVSNNIDPEGKIPAKPQFSPSGGNDLAFSEFYWSTDMAYMK